jgi:hypothetical protein
MSSKELAEKQTAHCLEEARVVVASELSQGTFPNYFFGGDAGGTGVDGGELAGLLGSSVS